MKHHADLLSPEYWQGRKDRILAGYMEDVFPYPQSCRFHQQLKKPQSLTTPAAEAA
jgi:isocitrate dehydrogenase kinase/phosphatase